MCLPKEVLSLVEVGITSDASPFGFIGDRERKLSLSLSPISMELKGKTSDIIPISVPPSASLLSECNIPEEAKLAKRREKKKLPM